MAEVDVDPLLESLIEAAVSQQIEKFHMLMAQVVEHMLDEGIPWDVTMRWTAATCSTAGIPYRSPYTLH